MRSRAAADAADTAAVAAAWAVADEASGGGAQDEANISSSNSVPEITGEEKDPVPQPCQDNDGQHQDTVLRTPRAVVARQDSSLRGATFTLMAEKVASPTAASLSGAQRPYSSSPHASLPARRQRLRLAASGGKALVPSAVISASPRSEVSPASAVPAQRQQVPVTLNLPSHISSQSVAPAVGGALPESGVRLGTDAMSGTAAALTSAAHVPRSSLIRPASNTVKPLAAPSPLVVRRFISQPTRGPLPGGVTTPAAAAGSSPQVVPSPARAPRQIYTPRRAASAEKSVLKA